MSKFVAHFTTRGYVTVQADSSAEAEDKAWEILCNLEGPGVEFDDKEIHAVE